MSTPIAVLVQEHQAAVQADQVHHGTGGLGEEICRQAGKASSRLSRGCSFLPPPSSTGFFLGKAFHEYSARPPLLNPQVIARDGQVLEHHALLPRTLVPAEFERTIAVLHAKRPEISPLIRR